MSTSSNPSAPIAYIYLHGFASSPQSHKAQYLRDRFAELDLDLQIPDLNQEDFSHLCLTRQIQQVAALFPTPKTPIVLIGSSFGGLTAAFLAQHYPQVQQLVLLAPAFGFQTYWETHLDKRQRDRWRAEKYLNVYHYGKQRELPLSYNFFLDLNQYDEGKLQRPVETRIIHGDRDEVIPLSNSQTYASDRPWVELRIYNSDHSLSNVLPQIWQEIREFIG